MLHGSLRLTYPRVILHALRNPGYIFGLFGYFFSGWFAHLCFGRGRSPITHPDPEMVLTNRKDLNSNKIKQSNPGMVDVVYRDRGDFELPAGQLAAAAGWRHACQLLFALVVYLLAGVLALPDRRPFLRGPLSPPTLRPIAMQWHEWAEKALIKNLKSREAGLTCRGGLVGSGLQIAHGVVHGVAEVPRLAVNAAQVDTGFNRLGTGVQDRQGTHRRRWQHTASGS